MRPDKQMTQTKAYINFNMVVEFIEDHIANTCKRAVKAGVKR